VVDERLKTLSIWRIVGWRFNGGVASSRKGKVSEEFGSVVKDEFEI